MNSNSIRLCILCLQEKADVVNIFYKFENVTIASILKQHFWTQIGIKAESSEFLCQICWNSTRTFHVFYEQVKLLHEDYWNSVDSDFFAELIKQEPSDIELQLDGTEIQPLDVTLDVCKTETIDTTDYNSEQIETFPTPSRDEANEKPPRKKRKIEDLEENKNKTAKKPKVEIKLNKNGHRVNDEYFDDQVRQYFNMKCDVCGDPFETYRSSQKHYRIVHSMKGYLICCGSKFRRRGAVLGHIKFHVDPNAYSCNQCSRKCSSKKTLRIHIANHEPMSTRAFKCDLCPKSFPRESSLIAHKNFVHYPVKCIECDLSYPSKSKLLTHMKNVHQPKVITTRVCDICGKDFANKYNLLNHMQQMHSNIENTAVQCDICGTWVNKGEGLPECICQICWNQTKTFHIFYKDVELLQEDYWNSVNNAATNVCTDFIKQEPCDTESQLDEAELEPLELVFEINKKEFVDSTDCHSEQIEISATVSKDVDKQQRRSMRRTRNRLKASSAIDRRQHNKRNQHEHRANDDYLDAKIRVIFSMKCDICDDAFETYREVHKHFRAAHNMKGYLICCGNKFLHRDSVISHIKFHSNPNEFSCGQCSQKFTSESELALHLTKHEPITSCAFNCELCLDNFMTENALIAHKNLVHLPFKCSQCEMSYPTKSKLRTHIKNAHKPKVTTARVCDVKKEYSTIEGPKLQCGTCGKMKKSKFSLNKHMRDAHAEKKHLCSICNRSYRTALILKEHMAGHTGQDLYKCAYCTRTFKSSANMYKHRKRIHLAKWVAEQTMDFNSTVGLCRLCLNESDDVMNIFDKFENTTIASILEQHFWFQVNKGEGLPECICQICWNNTKTFHIFYEEVELLQEDYWNSVKAVDYNVRTDSIKQEPELQIEETKLESSAVILEVIKKETNDYHSDDQIETDPTPSKNVDLEQYTKTNRTVKCLQVNNATKMKNIIKEKKPNDDEYRFNDDALDAQLHVFFSMKCDICGDPFDTYLSSLKHFRAAHKRRGYLTCCGNKFHRRIGMVNHIKYHLNPDAFSCHQCDRKFVNQGALALHLANHEPISSRAFKCDFCQKSYAREALLIRHKYFVHSPAKCVECDISYPSKSKLTTHLRNAHQLKGTSTEVGRNEELSQCICQGCWNNTRTFHIFYEEVELQQENYWNSVDAVDHNVCTDLIKQEPKETEMQFDLNLVKSEETLMESSAVIFKMHQDESIDSSDYISNEQIQTNISPLKDVDEEKDEKRTNSLSKLTTHIKNAHKPKVSTVRVCDICGKDFANKYTLLTHMQERHSAVNTPEVPCDICGNWLKNQSILKSHMKRHQESVPAECSQCGKMVKSKFSLSKHINYVHGEKKHQCSICSKSFRKSLLLKVTMNTFRQQNDLFSLKKSANFRNIWQFTPVSTCTNALIVPKHSNHQQICPLIGKRCITQSGLWILRKNALSDAMTSSTSGSWLLSCDECLCPKRTNTFDPQIIKDDGLPESICQICWSNTKTFHIFYEQVKLLQEEYWNSVEVVDYNVRTDLIKQEPSDTELQLEETELKPLEVILGVNKTENDYKIEPIEICPKPSRNVDKDKPLRKNTKIDELEGNKNTTTRKPRQNIYEYSVNNDYLDAQLRIYFDMKCDICGDPFETYRSAHKHYRTAHKIRGYLNCCGNKFYRRGLVLGHIKYHLDPNAFSCDQCNRKFTSESVLVSHIENHEAMSTRAFKCDLCPNSFTRETALNAHRDFVHCPVKCIECDITYPSKSKLKTHMKNVHQPKVSTTRVCDICGKDLANKYSLLTHMQKQHSAVTIPKVHTLRIHMKRHRESSPAECSHCGKVMKSKFSLTKHIQYVHAEKKHRCSICSKSFRSALILKEHTAVHTGQDLYKCAYCTRTFKSSANMFAHRKKMHYAEWIEHCEKKRSLLKQSPTK
ncbi:Transcription factor grauzone [Pseudolycoriella hygida]|uniref:Transcription factor grauzone n=1 Tax=Pseudolycoriella hygida TaxID=35572 RepID=A0A9Q0S242_9DIPT|nr:Transcription factor grauzone [Pseudolycoriella hygida]